LGCFQTARQSPPVYVLQQRGIALSTVLLKLATFERHLHEQARSLRVPVNQPPAALRVQIASALRSKLAQLGWGTEGDLIELRDRLRQAEILEEAKTLGMDITKPVTQVKELVFGYYKKRLQEEGASPRGNLREMKMRLEKVIRFNTLGPDAFKKKVVKEAVATKKGALKGKKKGKKKPV